MTDLEIAEIAMEFGDYDAKSQCYTFNGNGKFSILAFAAAIRAATKEEDAKICEKLAYIENERGRVFTEEGQRLCFEAIRASK